jgi:hypothetical protein
VFDLSWGFSLAHHVCLTMIEFPNVLIVAGRPLSTEVEAEDKSLEAAEEIRQFALILVNR